MKQKDKDLLLIKDLCSRLPYGVKIEVTYSKDSGSSLRARLCREGINILDTDILGLFQQSEIHIKPYLFPFSSMTEEQKKDLLTHVVGKNSIKYFQVTSKGCIDNIDAEEQELTKFHLHWVNFNCKTTSAYIDWCNKNHFDYRNLIPMGLANNATRLNIY